MGTIGRYNTKQSLALTTILENNHAVSEMAINRLGSVNPFLESAFTFLAFCTKDDIFSIPVEVISNYVMDGLKTDDDVDNCKMENSVRATIRTCPLFLLPKATITVQTQAVKDTLPPDTEGIFQSQLTPRTDLLPEIGDGSLTAAAMKDVSVTPKTPKTPKTPEDAKEIVKEATKTPSRPATQEKKESSRPATQEGKKSSRPSTREDQKPKSRPATREDTPLDTPSEKKAESRPQTKESDKKPESRPATQEKKVDDKKAEDKKAEDKKAEDKKAEDKKAEDKKA